MRISRPPHVSRFWNQSIFVRDIAWRARDDVGIDSTAAAAETIVMQIENDKFIAKEKTVYRIE